MSEPSGGGGVDSFGNRGTEREARDLLERIRRGDAEAFEAVAREQGPRLYRLALHLTGRREDAEDLAQETLVRALPALRGFQGRARLGTYLVRALTNLWKNRLRSKSRSKLVPWPAARREKSGGDDPAPREFPDGAASPERRLLDAERSRAVWEEVARLDPDRRLALLLREVEGMSYEAIAETTGVPVGTVRSRLARAREDLRARLDGGRS